MGVLILLMQCPAQIYCRCSSRDTDIDSRKEEGLDQAGKSKSQSRGKHDSIASSRVKRVLAFLFYKGACLESLRGGATHSKVMQ